MTPFGGAFQGLRVLVTGHTGFKGSWLCLWLQALGAKVTGLALPPDTQPSHFDLLNLKLDDRRQDIRDAAAVARIVTDTQPQMVLHLAAQPLVRDSYADPLKTWSTNVMGTANILDACRITPSVRAVVLVTTDKCYENDGRATGYREDDKLGGHDPYSASKAGAELVAASYRRSFFSQPGAALIATARAGNVIGGGDWSRDRLIPDLARAMQAGQPLTIRSPRATRPWQHVLEALSGYLMLAQRLLAGDTEFAEAWNFGPDDAGNQPVEIVLTEMQRHWPALQWIVDAGPQPHEAAMLHLDSGKARQRLGWHPVWSLEQGLAATAEWYKSYSESGMVISRDQLAKFMARTV